MRDRLIKVWFIIGWYPLGILYWHILAGWSLPRMNFAQFYISFLVNTLLVLCLNYIFNDKITICYKGVSAEKPKNKI